MDDSPEDMYIEDNYIRDIKAEKIEEKEEKMSSNFSLKKKQMQKAKPTLKNILFYYLF